MAAMNEIKRFGAGKVLLFGLGAFITGNKRWHRE
jgi:hypothetical protein